MIAFTVRDCGIVERGIRLAKDGAIHVGAYRSEPMAGREPRIVRVELPPGCTVEGDLLVELPSASDAALVLIRDHSGFDGHWGLYRPYTDDEWAAIRRRDAAHWGRHGGLMPGHQRFPGASCAACDAVAPQPRRKAADISIIARGRATVHRYSGLEILAVFRDGEAAEIERNGRLYGAPRVLTLRFAGGDLNISDPVAEARSRAASDRLQRAIAYG